jgi:hypothetical protein
MVRDKEIQKKKNTSSAVAITTSSLFALSLSVLTAAYLYICMSHEPSSSYIIHHTLFLIKRASLVHFVMNEQSEWGIDYYTRASYLFDTSYFSFPIKQLVL